jgi:hypothetical protein
MNSFPVLNAVNGACCLTTSGRPYQRFAGYWMSQEAVNVTTEIQEELFLKMGVGDLPFHLPFFHHHP